MSTSHEGGNRGEEGTSSETETREGEPGETDESIRTSLRRRTLEMWLALRNRRVKLHLHSGVRASGTFQTIDAKHENLVISDLDSGAGTIPVALVRWSDVLSMTTDGAEGPSATLSG